MIDVTAGTFHSALRQAAVVTNQESRGIDFNFDNGTLTLAASTAAIDAHTNSAPQKQAVRIALKRIMEVTFPGVLGAGLRQVHAATLQIVDEGKMKTVRKPPGPRMKWGRRKGADYLFRS